ncbi:hypothetical protein E4U41_004513 [Claviceps citrina]|nr:hypothetical protein E4U41_004513 [Claviceps citrina]
MEEVIVIGVDFGTTYSGVAWAYSREPEDIEVITNWDSDFTHCSDELKSPSVLKFGGSGEKDEWGYVVKPGGDSLRWFKLLLLLDEKDVDPVTYNCAELKEARRVRDASGKSAVEIVSKYLQLLWNHAINNIEIAFDGDSMAKCRFDVVMTLPAIWPPYAQQRMKQAAEMAGILEQRPCGTTLLRFVSEPEAAALSTLGDQANKSTVKVDDTFVICDAGGGTVDLISYRVSEKSPFTLKECVKGDGGLCGGIFLDKSFLELVEKKVGPSWRKVSKNEELEFMNDKWEHGIKRQFRGTPRTWRVDTPGAVTRPGLQKRARGIDLETSEILTVFDPIIRQYVILVGGFGRNSYLRDCLARTVDAGTKVLQSQGTKPWVAICRGAVLYGITLLRLPRSGSVKVESRVSRMSYGIIVQELFNRRKHLVEDKYFDCLDDKWKARRQMSWFLKQGQKLSAKTRIWKSFHYAQDEPLGIVTEEFYVSASHEPPTRQDDSVTQLCSVTWNKVAPFESLPVHYNAAGKEYRKLEFDIEMTCDGTSIHFTIYYKGKAMADHDVVVEYE